MLKLGSGEVYYGGIGEHNMIQLAKHPRGNTQRRYESLTPQLATQVYETKILEFAYELGKLQLQMSDISYDKDIFRSDLLGEHEIQLFQADSRGRRDFEVAWKNSPCNEDNTKLMN